MLQRLVLCINNYWMMRIVVMYSSFFLALLQLSPEDLMLICQILPGTLIDYTVLSHSGRSLDWFRRNWHGVISTIWDTLPATVYYYRVMHAVIILYRLVFCVERSPGTATYIINDCLMLSIATHTVVLVLLMMLTSTCHSC